MFADSLTVTINSVAKVLSRINQDKYTAEYLLRETGGEFRLRIRHSTVNPAKGASSQNTTERHNIELAQVVYATPTVPQITRRAYVVLENQNSDGATDSLHFDSGFVDFLSDTTLTKLINWES